MGLPAIKNHHFSQQQSHPSAGIQGIQRAPCTESFLAHDLESDQACVLPLNYPTVWWSERDLNPHFTRF